MIEKYFDGEIPEIVVGIGRCETVRLHGKFASLQTYGKFRIIIGIGAVLYKFSGYFLELYHWNKG